MKIVSWTDELWIPKNRERISIRKTQGVQILSGFILMFHSWQVNSFYQWGMRVECNALLWPLLQFRCCGVTNHTDWFEVYNTTRVPDSCCLEYSDNCGLDNPGTWWTAVRSAKPAAPPSFVLGDQRKKLLGWGGLLPGQNECLSNVYAGWKEVSIHFICNEPLKSE